MSLLSAEAASRAFARAITALAPSGATAADLIGLEHEFVVRSGDGVVDFRQLIRGLPLDGRSLDPGDVNAVRCRWGGVVTADGAEAEVAVAPLRRRPGFVARLEASALRARDALSRALPDRLALSGYSTHLSFSMPHAVNEAACRLFLSTFAPGLMLLADRADSPGLLVRPRPGRMELAFEFASDAHLRAASAYATGAAIASARAVHQGAARLPPPIQVRSVTTGDRYGFGLTRDAFGVDLLAAGRDAVLIRADGGTIRAQDHLELAWEAARAAIARSSAGADVLDADRAVAGRSPLPIEGPAPVARVAARPVPTDSAYGAILRPMRRPGFTATAEIATWDTTIFAIDGRRRVYASVPRDSLRGFLRSLERAELDAAIGAFLEAPASGRILATWDDAIRPGLFDAVAAPRSLLAPEVPLAGTTDRARAGKAEPPGIAVDDGRGTALGRDGAPRSIMPMLVAVGLVALLVIGGLVARGLTGTPASAPSSTAAVTAAPGVATPAAAGLRITGFRAVLQPPDTTYSVTVANPNGGPLTYQWSASTSCPGFQASTAPTAVWSHPHPPCPGETFHPGSITVVVRDATGAEARYTYTGGSSAADIVVPAAP